jgi:hypothetical protein
MYKKLSFLTRSTCLFLMTALFLCFSLTASSQVSKSAAGQLTDQQIMMLAQQAKMSGMSDADLINMLSKQGSALTI